MVSAAKVVRNLYRDSVSLMRISAVLTELPGVRQASVVMATAANLAMLREAGLLDREIAAGPNDLMIALNARSEPALAAALEKAEIALSADAAQSASSVAQSTAPRSMAMAKAQAPNLNLALVSTPGDYAAAEAMKALQLGLNVMLFSDNVAEEDEVALKKIARRKGLLMMGPDCGTAIINGIPLAFANVVRRGSIGCVAASGTGLQQVTCLVDRLGFGISQAIGTGGRDLSKAVGGMTMLQGIEALAADTATEVIVLISKPPAPAVARKVLKAASRAGKPIVVSFVGAGAQAMQADNLHPVDTLEDAARAAVALARGRKPIASHVAVTPPRRIRFAADQRYVRGLYSGGTFCYEASLLLREALGQVWSNAPVHKSDQLPDVSKSREHTVIDLGDDVFTRGRPHPMIDHRLRNERMIQEAADRRTAVILFDVVLGHGSHPDPAAAMLPAIETARSRAARAQRDVAFVGFVCGTRGDPQGLSRQEKTLRDAGVWLMSSNAEAVRVAAAIVKSRGR